MLDKLPIEVLVHLYGFFNEKNDKDSFSGVNRKFNRIFWSELCVTNYGFHPKKNAREIYLAMIIIDDAINIKIPVDPKEIDLCYKKLIEYNANTPGNSEILYHLAKLYLKNNTPYQNIELGKSFCEQAAALNHNGAKQLLGSFYRDGLYDYPFDELKAIQYYKEAADGGSNDAAVALGISFRDGHGSIKRNADQAIFYLNKAVNRNDNRAARILGLSYCDGLGAIPPNQEKAILYYKTAAQRGDNTAARDLGSSFRDGLGSITKNPNLAIEYFRMAALRGDTEAAISLGVSFVFGKGCIVKNHDEAVFYLTLAANAGDGRAVKMLERFNLPQKQTLSFN